MTHYQILGVPPDATPEAIKSGYRQKAVIHHPDKGGSAALFQQLGAAYEMLSDPEKRKRYDFIESQKPVESLRGSMDTLVTKFFEELQPDTPK